MDPSIIRAPLLQEPRKMARQVSMGISGALHMIIKISYRVRSGCGHENAHQEKDNWSSITENVFDIVQALVRYNVKMP